MFNSPPSPLPGEHVASLVYRAFQQNCFERVESWCNDISNGPFFDMPQRGWVPLFQSMGDALSPYYSPSSFITNFTNLTDYSLFLSRKQFAGNTSELFLKRMGKLKFENGLSVANDRHWRYCPHCATEDEERFGTTFFHVAHQHYYKRICERHGVYLKASISNDFTLPPINTAGITASREAKYIERQLIALIHILKLLPSEERKPRLLCLLKQKIGLSELKRLKQYNFVCIRDAHQYLASIYNSTEIKHYFTWEYLVPGFYPFEATNGLLFMLKPERCLHPMLYLLFGLTFLSSQEQQLLTDLPFRPNNLREPMPLTLIPQSFSKFNHLKVA